MNCPNCDTPEQARVKVCPGCGIAYASQDLLELRQLEFLLQETASWPGTEALRQHYAVRLEALRARLLPPKVPKEMVEEAIPEAEPVPTPQPTLLREPALQAAAPAQTPPPEVQPAPRVVSPPAPRPEIRPKPKAEPVPFDQWLLSERNIKIALYTGGLLLIIAGLIFVGANWARIPGPAKFAVMVAITIGMYLGGALLFKRRSLRLGGVALLAVASGFFLLDFVVLQVYVFRGLGLDDRVMWLICSILALLVYLLTAYWTRAALFTYLSIVAVASAVTAGMAMLDLPLTDYPLVYSVLAIFFFMMASGLRSTRVAKFTYLPLMIVSQIAAPLLFLTSLVLWSNLISGTGSPWLALAAMSVGVLFYIITDLIFHWIFARWAAAIAFFVTSLCVLLELNISVTAILVALMILAITYHFIGSAILRKSRQLNQALPLLAVAHVSVPWIFLTSLLLWISPDLTSQASSPWLALAAMFVSVLFYVITDLMQHWIFARWAAAFAFAATVICTLVQLDFSLSASSFTLLILALAFLLAGFILRRRTNHLDQALPLYVAGYAVAVIATLQVGLTFNTNSQLLAQILVGDVILLAISAIIHRQDPWAYGAAWLFIAPVTIYAQVYLPGGYEIGLALFALLVTYAAVGFFVSRRNLRWAGSFLSAAAFLSLVVVPLVWMNSLAASLILGAIAVLYLLFAVWLGWFWLLLPMLVAVHLAVISGLDIFYYPGSPWGQALTIAYAVLGVILILVGIGLRRLGRPRWAWLILAFAVLDLAGSYLYSLVLGGWFAMALSAVYACLAFWLAWEEKQVFIKASLPPVLTYLSAFFVFIGHFYSLADADLAWNIWPPFTAGLCALLVVVSWLLRRGELGRVYGTPLHRAGLILILLPLLEVVLVTNTDLLTSFGVEVRTPLLPGSILQAITFAIASAVYFADAAIRRNPILAYVGGGAFVVVIWSVLVYFRLDELQAFILPLGLGLILVGWSEGRLGRRESYRWTTLCGLLILMGSAFYQSIDSPVHAALLLVESLLALGWGIRIHSRSVVVVAGIALLANAVAQLGPAFIELPSWIQIGVIGSLLLGGGLLALFRREQVISARKQISEDWKKWQP